MGMWSPEAAAPSTVVPRTPGLPSEGTREGRRRRPRAVVVGRGWGPLAQLAEHRTFNPPVAGSIPAGPTGKRPLTRHDARSGAIVMPARTRPIQRKPSIFDPTSPLHISEEVGQDGLHVRRLRSFRLIVRCRHGFRGAPQGRRRRHKPPDVCVSCRGRPPHRVRMDHPKPMVRMAVRHCFRKLDGSRTAPVAEGNTTGDTTPSSVIRSQRPATCPPPGPLCSPGQREPTSDDPDALRPGDAAPCGARACPTIVWTMRVQRSGPPRSGSRSRTCHAWSLVPLLLQARGLRL